MSVLKQNPFLAGFGAFMLVGAGTLGYLGYSAMDENSAARKDYEEKRSDLSSLQGYSIHPDEKNLKEIKAIKLALQAKVDGLQKDLSGTKIKVDPISPAAFQDKLKDTVVSIMERSVEARVKFPGNEKDKEKFYLGFDDYKSTQPKQDAAPALNRELKAIETVVNLLLETRNVEVKELNRPNIREEKDPKPGAEPKKGKNSNEAGGRPLIDRQTFHIGFVTTQDNLKKILNGIVGNPQQLFVVRNLSVHNEKQEPPNKLAAVPAAPPPPAPADPKDPKTPGTPPAATPDAAGAIMEAGKKEFIFGKELVEATLQIDIVDVLEPTAPTPEKGAAKK
jgi:hypothetical protein